jgi:acyl-CoA thioesterase-1
MSKILCFGDSITWGAWDTKGGWVARVRERIDRRCIDSQLETFVLTYNLGISSDTSERILGRLESEIKTYSIEEGDIRFIFSIGTNDSSRLIDQDKYRVAPDIFKLNIAKIILIAKKYSDDIVFVGNMPVDETKTNPYQRNLNYSSKNSDIEKYQELTKNACDEEGIDFISIFKPAFSMPYTEFLFEDGLHPNDKGHQYIADQVLKYVDSKNWIVS